MNLTDEIPGGGGVVALPAGVHHVGGADPGRAGRGQVLGCPLQKETGL